MSAIDDLDGVLAGLTAAQANYAGKRSTSEQASDAANAAIAAATAASQQLDQAKLELRSALGAYQTAFQAIVGN